MLAPMQLQGEHTRFGALPDFAQDLSEIRMVEPLGMVPYKPVGKHPRAIGNGQHDPKRHDRAPTRIVGMGAEDACQTPQSLGLLARACSPIVTLDNDDRFAHYGLAPCIPDFLPEDGGKRRSGQRHPSGDYCGDDGHLTLRGAKLSRLAGGAIRRKRIVDILDLP